MSGLPGTLCRRRIYLMRHADVSYFDAAGQPLDPRHVPLTETGRQQAAAAGKLLAAVAFDAAICSGLARTEETARLVLGERDLPLRHEPRFKEVKAGRLADIPAARREQVIAHAYDDAPLPDAAFMGGERWRDVQTRALAAWDDLFAENAWLNLLLVAHDAINRILLAHIVGVGLAGLRAFEQDPACLNIIEVDVAAGRPQRAFLRAVNLAAYDPVRAGSHLTVLEKILRQYKPTDGDRAKA
ncbi:MAG: histidine phosphatase family protein [Azonexus sp.]|jgi:probable phosphoglycerate mutase|nr:histidine phosphatase family protein [Azonexus sp.]